MNIFLKILKLLLITVLLFFLLSFTLKNEHKNERKINLIEFDMSTERFVTKEEILTSCFNWQHDNQIQNLDVAKIEENIRRIPQINEVNVYLNHDGNIDNKLNELVQIVIIYDGESSY